MRVKIEYSTDAASSTNFPYWAKSVINEKIINTCGSAWDTLRKEHIQKLAAVVNAAEPPMSEEVEV